MNTDDGWPKVWAKMSDEERELSVSLRKKLFLGTKNAPAWSAISVPAPTPHNESS